MRTMIPVLLATVFASCTPPRSDLVPADYRVIGLTFGGPTSITNGRSTTYTATVSIARTAHPERRLTESLRVLVKNDPADEQEIASLPVEWPPFDASPKTVSIALACRKLGPVYGVSGNFGRSEKGGAICAATGGACTSNPAVTYVSFSPAQSTRIPVTCDIPAGAAPAGTRCGGCTGFGQGSCGDGLVCHDDRCEEPCPPGKTIDAGCRCADPPKLAL